MKILVERIEDSLFLDISLTKEELSAVQDYYLISDEIELKTATFVVGVKLDHFAEEDEKYQNQEDEFNLELKRKPYAIKEKLQ